MWCERFGRCEEEKYHFLFDFSVASRPGADPLLSTFDTDLVTAGGDLMATTLAWHVHRPNKTAFVAQLLGGAYGACCDAKLAATARAAASLKSDRSTKWKFAPACADAGIADPDDRVCHRFDAAWLPAMVAAGYAPRFEDVAKTPDHTLCALGAGTCPD